MPSGTRLTLKEDLRAVRERMVSVLTIHEIYRVILEREGREVAILRSETIQRDFNVVDVDYETAVRSAELRSKHRIPMVDSVIAATAQIHGCHLVSAFARMDFQDQFFPILILLVRVRGRHSLMGYLTY